MRSLWKDDEILGFANDPVKLRIYTTRLLGQHTDLVLHGGGNTSVKTSIENIFGDIEDIIYIKGSGVDMASIDKSGFAPVRLDILRRMAGLDHLADGDMVRLFRSAMVDHAAPNPSLEAIVHAMLPFKFVDHTHSDAVVTITNNERGRGAIEGIYQSRILLVPYVKSGFQLSKAIFELTKGQDWSGLDGLILENHGIFTFSDDARTSYERMIELVTLAEEYLSNHGAFEAVKKGECKENLLLLAQIRRAVSKARGAPLVAIIDQRPEACGFASLRNVRDIAGRGCITPDHAIRTKPTPAILDRDPVADVQGFVAAYNQYFARHNKGGLTPLDPAPRWVIWPGHGVISFGTSLKEARVVYDIAEHTMRAIQWGEAIGGWKPVSENHLFDMEYWELQQAKLLKARADPEFQGKIALVTGAASGIGLACAQALHKRGAAVIGLDISPVVTGIINLADMVGVECDVIHYESLKGAVEGAIRRFGGLDILVSNAGTFPASTRIEDMDHGVWNRSIEINLTSHQRLLQLCIPYLKLGLEPAIVLVASKNVPAPGPGAAAYSVAKAGETQLARIAALELAAFGIRVNMVHPDAIFDTGIWTEEVLRKRAEHYGMSVQQYKTKNLLRTELQSKDVANLVCALAGTPFAKTTGAQVPIDGGNERVI